MVKKEIQIYSLKEDIRHLRENLSKSRQTVKELKETRSRVSKNHKKRKEQAIHNYKEISELQKILYKLHPELKDAYNGYGVESRNRDNNQCIFCFRNVFEVDPNRLTHHIIPRRLIRIDSMDNLATVCGDCHDILERFNDKLISHLNSQSKPKTK